MRAIQLTKFSGLSGLTSAALPVPDIRRDEVLVEVRAFGLSFSDLLIADGAYQSLPALPLTLGSDFAGDVVSIGEDVTRFQVGQRVAGFRMFAASAELVAVEERSVFPLPDAVSYEVGAGLPLNYLTAHFALKERGQVTPSDTVLVHGAAGGVGIAAVQLAKAWRARVIGVASTEEKLRFVRDAGADDAVLTASFAQAVDERTDSLGVDIVIDPVGGDVLQESLRVLAPGGRLMVVGFAGGSEIPQVKVNRLLLRNIDVRGASWGAHVKNHPDFSRTQWDEITAMMQARTLVPTEPTIRRAAEVVAALEEIQSRRAIGKTVVVW